MKAILEMHVLQNFAPSNLNRDDTGSPKDAIFGGFRRARVSSQCLKRSMRTYVRDHQLLPPGHMAERTKRLLEAISTRLQDHGHSAEESTSVARLALGGLKLVSAEDKTQYLVFLGESEMDAIAETIHQNWSTLSEAVRAQAAASDKKGKSAKDAKKDASAAVPEEVRKALSRAIRDRGQGGDAVDLAFFGRMLADRPEKNQDAACQVAHALSTHRVDREYDFYTAVDDRKPDDTAGADMLGTVEFNSACFYRYLSIDLNLLRENLQNDDELLAQGLKAFLHAAVLAVPTGKQNSFAAHNPPSFIGFVVRRDQAPRNLANAFVKPAGASERLSLVEHSVKKLASEWQRLDGFLGAASEVVYWNGCDEAFPIGQALTSCDELVTAATERALTALKN